MIHIYKDTVDYIKNEAMTYFPREICGLLVGTDYSKVEYAIKSKNIAKSLNRFEIDPILRIRVEKNLRGTKNKIIGHYHSHPKGQSDPSRKDIDSINELNMVWLIIALNKKRITDLKAWKPNDFNKFNKIKIIII